jgi:hypothetical protein
MKKTFLFLLLILIFSIITENYSYCHINQQINIELSTPSNFTHIHFEEHNDSHEFIVENFKYQDLNTSEKSENTILNLKFHTQEFNLFIWQPPEMKL